MSEIRDEILEDLLSIKGMTPDMVNAVIAHPNIAIVDREAELPDYPTGEDCLAWYSRAQRDMVKAGWLKEAKDGPSGK